MKSQDNTTKKHGFGTVIAEKTGFSSDYVNRVLRGAVPTGGQKARRILEIAEKLIEALNEA